MSINKLDFISMLSDFVNSNYISEWQAGYITGILDYQNDNSIIVNKEEVYSQLLLFIRSYIHNKEK